MKVSLALQDSGSASS